MPDDPRVCAAAPCHTHLASVPDQATGTELGQVQVDTNAARSPRSPHCSPSWTSMAWWSPPTLCVPIAGCHSVLRVGSPARQLDRHFLTVGPGAHHADELLMRAQRV